MKVNISELLETLPLEAVLLKERPFSRTGEVKQEVFRRIHQEKGSLKQKKGWKRTLLIAAVVAVAAVSVAAYAGVLPQSFYSSMFGARGEETNPGVIEMDEQGSLTTNIPGWERVSVDDTLADRLIASYAMPQNGTLRWGDYTLSTQLNLYDPATKTGILCFTLENPNGLSGYQVYPDGELSFTGETVNVALANGYGRLYLDDESSTETKLSIVTYYIAAEDAPVELAFFGFTSGAVEEAGTIPMTQRENGSMTAYTTEDGAVTISPIGLRVEGIASSENSGDGLSYVELRYQDGTVYTVRDENAFIDNSSYAIVTIDGPERAEGTLTKTEAERWRQTQRETCTYVFNRVVDLNALSAVVIGDAVYSIKN